VKGRACQRARAAARSAACGDGRVAKNHQPPLVMITSSSSSSRRRRVRCFFLWIKTLMAFSFVVSGPSANSIVPRLLGAKRGVPRAG
jgi:hypothetical protein